MTIEKPDGNSFMKLVDAASSILESAPDKALKSDESSTKKKTDCDDTSSVKSDFSVSSNKKSSFAEYLMDIVDEGDKPGNTEACLVWMPDGMGFTIVNSKKFTKEVMPKLFQIKNMSSFVRKLGRWGFHRVHDFTTKNSDIFKHPKFQKGNRELCAQIKCVSAQGQSSTAGSSSNNITTTRVTRVALTPSKSNKLMMIGQSSKSGEAIKNRAANRSKNLSQSQPISTPKIVSKPASPTFGPHVQEESGTSPPDAIAKAEIELRRHQQIQIEKEIAARVVRSSILAAAAASSPSAAANNIVLEHLIKSAATHRFQRQQKLAEVAAAASALPSWLLATAATEQALYGAHPLGSALQTSSLFR